MTLFVHLTWGGEMIEIPLFGTKSVALIDEEDYRLVFQYKWHIILKSNTYYAETCSPVGKCMHRYILGDKPGLTIDHIDGNGLNNQKYNLRHVTTDIQRLNTIKESISGYRGVQKDHNRYKAKINYKGKQIYLGSFGTPERAYTAFLAKHK